MKTHSQLITMRRKEWESAAKLVDNWCYAILPGCLVDDVAVSTPREVPV